MLRRPGPQQDCNDCCHRGRRNDVAAFGAVDRRRADSDRSDMSREHRERRNNAVLVVRGNSQCCVADCLPGGKHESQGRGGRATSIDGRNDGADARAGEEQQDHRTLRRRHASAAECVGGEGYRSGRAADKSAAQLRDISEAGGHRCKGYRHLLPRLVGAPKLDICSVECPFSLPTHCGRRFRMRSGAIRTGQLVCRLICWRIGSFEDQSHRTVLCNKSARICGITDGPMRPRSDSVPTCDVRIDSTLT